MNTSTYVHILNGDSLNQQFPIDLSGERIICRECLCDGPVNAQFPNDFYKQRTEFITSLDDEIQISDYYEKTVLEFEKLNSISSNAEICFWFEDDLFCQVNFWFSTWLIHNQQKGNTFSLVRPNSLSPYGFGAYSQNELKTLFENRVQIKDLMQFVSLWNLYKSNNLKDLLSQGQNLSSEFSFIQEAINAHLDRFPSDKNELPRPEKVLLEIASELHTKQFGSIFKEFCKREPIYGFGDLQVKKIYDKLL